MWFLFYLALNSPVNVIQGFPDREACETFKAELRKGIQIKQSACVQMPQPEHPSHKSGDTK